MGFELGDWVQRRYGYGDAQWGRISGRFDDLYDCWYVTVIGGSIYHDNGRDLFHSTKPPYVSDDYAIAPELSSGQTPDWLAKLVSEGNG
jgi:hypothetical protein